MAEADTPKPYGGELDSQQAASAMQAARLNAIELLDTADILFNLKRFPHSVVFSILAIEEAGKLPILQALGIWPYSAIDEGGGGWDRFSRRPDLSLAQNPRLENVPDLCQTW